MIVLLLFLAFLFMSCGSSNRLLEEEIVKIDTIHVKDTFVISGDTVIRDTIYLNKDIYRNPIIKTSLPDPTVIKAPDGFFYLYATEDIRNTPIYKSKNLVDWDFVGTAFNEETRPQINSGHIWAPDINYINGQYVLYYSQSAGDLWTCGIGAAVSHLPQGPFLDKGKLFTSEEIGVKNSIDPFFIRDNDHNYLLWGSQHGIYGIELSDDGLSLKGEKKEVAKISMEGTYVKYHDGYYYLFGSVGTCCRRLESSYHVIVARSENLFGPYKKKEGKSQYEVLLKKNDLVVGPGHNAEFVTDDEGQDWIIYHGYLASDPDAGRVVFLDPVYWKDGWPYVNNDSPSKIHVKPYFNK